MIIDTSKRTVGIGAAVGVIGATALTWLALTQGGSTSASAPRGVQQPAAATSSATTDMGHMGVMRPTHTSVAAPTHTTVGVTAAQVRAIAARAGGGTVQEIGPGDLPGRATYDVAVVRADGTDVTVVVDAHSGAVLARDWDGTDAPTPPDPQPADNAPENTTEVPSGD